MVDAVRQQERGVQVEGAAALAAVRTKLEGVQALQLAQLVQRVQVGVHVVRIISIGRVFIRSPLCW